MPGNRGPYGKCGINNLKWSQLADFEIPLPPLPEQKRIVAILDEAFEGIGRAVANAEKNLANARELFEGYLNAVFMEKGEGWAETPLGKIADFKNGLNFTKNSKGERITIVGVRDFQRNFWVPTGKLATVQIDGTLPSGYELRSGDILTVRSNGNKQLIGRCILADDVPEKTSHSGFTIRIRVKSKDLDPAFLVHQMKTSPIRSQLIESGDGANISSLNQRALGSLPILVAPHDEQVEVVESIERIAAESTRLEENFRSKISAIADLKQSILQKAFAGELTKQPDRALAMAGA